MKELKKSCLVSIVAPAYNEEENLVSLYQEVVRAMEADNRRFELLIVENGSNDRSIDILKALNKKDERLNYLSLSRNFGHQGAIIAGLEWANGDVVVTMDADLQHPPQMIPKMLALWEKGFDVVYTTKREVKEQPIMRRLVNGVFYSILSKLSGLELTGGQSDFRLIDRKALNALLRLPERNKFLRGLTRWIGFRQVGLEYNVAPRLSGNSKFRMGHLVKFALDGVLSFSVFPLRILSVLGLIVSFTAFFYGVFFILGVKLYALVMDNSVVLPPGWVTVATAVIFFGGINLMGIGLIGEYVGRIYDETKGRPVYIIKEHSADRQDEGNKSRT